MGAQPLRSPARIQAVPEHLHVQARQLRPMHPPQQLLRLPGEHRAGDHVQSSCVPLAHAATVRAAAPEPPGTVGR